MVFIIMVTYLINKNKIRLQHLIDYTINANQDIL